MSYTPGPGEWSAGNGYYVRELPDGTYCLMSPSDNYALCTMLPPCPRGTVRVGKSDNDCETIGTINYRIEGFPFHTIACVRLPDGACRDCDVHTDCVVTAAEWAAVQPASSPAPVPLPPVYVPLPPDAATVPVVQPAPVTPSPVGDGAPPEPGPGQSPASGMGWMIAGGVLLAGLGALAFWPRKR